MHPLHQDIGIAQLVDGPFPNLEIDIFPVHNWVFLPRGLGQEDPQGDFLKNFGF